MSGGGRQARRWRAAGYSVAALLALAPIVRMVLLIREGTALQYNDYWLLIDQFVQHDGSLNVGGLFEFEHQNHPVVVPMLAYWLNTKLFAGSNIALGLFVVAIAVAILAILAAILRRTELRPVEQTVVFVLASCLLFTPNGAWNYAMSMSGTAWVGAGLVGVVAVFLRSRDRPVLAVGVAIVGAFTYATGLMVWPAVAAVGACRRPLREWWREWPYAAGFVANFAWYREVQTVGLGTEVPWPGPVDAVRTLARLLVLPLGLEGTLALYTGLVVLAAILALLVAFAVRWRSPEAAVWVGITVFGLMASMSLAIGRHQTPLVLPSSDVVWISGLGAQSRYSSVPALALIGGSGLLVMALRHRRAERSDRSSSAAVTWAPLAALGAVALLAATSGDEHADRQRDFKDVQDLREIALQLDLTDGTPYLMGLDLSVTDLLVDIGHHPFVDGWDLDCGLFDEQLPPDVVADERSAGEIVSARNLDATLDGAPELTGLVDSDRPIRCVVIADRAGHVVGAATLVSDDLPGADGDTDATGFVGIARPGSDIYRAYAVFDGSSGGEVVPIDEIGAADITRSD